MYISFLLKQQQNDELAAQIQEQMERNKQSQEDHKQQVLHIETLNMMTKYQLVFVKLETLMHKILMNIEARKKMRIKKAFFAFRYNSQSFRLLKEKKNNKNRLVCVKFEQNINAMVNAVQRIQERLQLSFAFRQVKLHYLQKVQEDKTKQKNIKKINELQQELVQSIKKCETIVHRQEELDNEMNQTKKKMQEQQRYMKDLEERDVHLNNEYIQLLEKQNSGTQERVNVKDLEDKVYLLEGQISEIEQENNQLKGKLDTTNSSVGTFIKEMSTLLDSHELQNILSMEVESEEDEEIDRMLDAEYDEQRPHAGTGGSSKMRARPNQQQNQGVARAQIIQNNQQQVQQQQMMQHQQQQQQQQMQQQTAQRKQQQQQNISNRMMAQLISGQNKQQNSKTSGNYNSTRQNR